MTLRNYSQIIKQSTYPSLCREIEQLWGTVQKTKKKSRTVTKNFVIVPEDESDTLDDEPDMEAVFNDEGIAAAKKYASAMVQS